MSAPDWVYVRGDDWCGLYANGELIQEGHSIDWPTVIVEEFLPAAGGTWGTVWADLDWLDEQGHLPHNLSEVKRES